MNIRSKMWLAVSFVLIASMLAACTTPTPETITEVVTQVVTQEVVTTQIVEKTVEVQVTPEPVQSSRKGGWLDRIVVVEEGSQESAVTRLQSGDLDVFAFSADDPNVFETVKADPNLDYVVSYGSYNELSFNIYEFADGKLNPFTNQKIREAMNMLIDRDYIVQEIAGGLGSPKLVPLTGAYPDYARFIAKIRELEQKYAYNPDKVNEIVTAEMTGMGAELVDGKWSYNGEPVVLVGLIRVEDSRLQIGDYFATQLESINFTVDRQYKTSAEASPIWLRGNPADGLWNFYTGGWIGGVIDRNDVYAFAQYYTNMVMPYPLFQGYDPGEELFNTINRIFTVDYASLEERAQLYESALEGVLEYSPRIWVIDQASFSPFRSDVSITGDLAGGISGSFLWPYTLRYKDQEGGSLTMAGASILTDPWNPVYGSNWVYDAMAQRATQTDGFVPDPFTGLYWPVEVERTEVVAKEGLPIFKSLDWVDLQFAPEIQVPADAWADWDPVAQEFITAGERFTDTVTANVKSTVYYPADFWQKTKWHDGSPISMGDFVLGMIMTFDTAKPESAIYDEAAVGAFDSFMSAFKGVVVESVDPLVITTYSDQYQLDAEWIFWDWFPTYGYGQGPWPTVALGVRAETAGTLAFSVDKATAKEIEWMSFIAGPSLEILKTEMDAAIAENYLPYAPTMSQYVTPEEITARYDAMQKWYQVQGHFWIGTGPYFLDKVFPVEGTLTLLNFPDFPYLSSRFDRFGEPKFATVEVDGEGTVTIGQEATFDVYVDFNGEPYPASEIDSVAWLLFDATGALAGRGEAEMVADGQYSVTLPADVTSALTAGANTLEVAVTSNVISIPGLGSFEFVTTAP